MSPPPSTTTSRTVDPLPARTLAILFLCRLAEPIAFNSIMPYLTFMVRDVLSREYLSRHAVDSSVTKPNFNEVPFYVGLITSSFFVAQFLSGLLWSRLVAILPRKPLVLFGSFSMATLMVLFGLSRTLAAMWWSRFFAGFLNGNQVVVNTMFGELTTPNNRARAFALLPTVFYVGQIVGPYIGGSLADPVQRWESLGKWKVLRKFPYLLPNIFVGAICLLSFIVGLLFLHSTTAAHERTRTSSTAPSTTPSSTITPTPTDAESAPISANSEVTPLLPPTNPSNSSIFTRPIISSLTTYTLTNLLLVAYNVALPLFLSLPPLSLPASTIGLILSLTGLASMLAQSLIYEPVHQALGTKWTLRFGIVLFVGTYAGTAYMPEQGSRGFWWVLGVVLVLKTLGQCLALTSSLIHITESVSHSGVSSTGDSKSTSVLLGKVNGWGQVVASAARAAGPWGIGTLMSASVARHGGDGTGLVVWALGAGFGVVGLIVSFW
ncbi:hypothetical protein YB2330_001080 [Saitoella coloradoensis]